MKRIVVLFFAASCLFVSCNPKDNVKDDDEVTTKDKDKDKDEEESIEEESDDAAKVASGTCNCMSDYLDGLSTKAKRILVKAGNSSEPTQTLTSELMKITDEEEKQNLGREFQKIGQIETDQDMQNCIEKLNKKYNLKEGDKKMQNKIVRELEDKEECEVVAALMKIGIKEENRNTNDVE